MIEHKSKKMFYSEKLIKFQGNVQKTWCTMTELIGKVKSNKSSLPSKISTDKAGILGETNINEFYNIFTNINSKLAKKIAESSQSFKRYIYEECQLRNGK